MGGFSEQFIDDVRARTSLVGLIQSTVALKRHGREFKGLCPFHKERTPSFTVIEDKGFYHCFGCGAHGDAFDWLTERHGMKFPDAVEELAVRAGLAPDREGRVRPKAAPIRRQTAAEAVRETRSERAKALAIWRASRPAGGTPVDTYLRSRGIVLADFPPTLRFHPGLDYWTPNPDDRRGRPVLLGRFPAMVAYMQLADRSFGGVHRTYLAPDGTGKAAVPSAKKIRGDYGGGYIRLCPAARRMCTAEGIETALSVMLASGVPTWAAISEGNFGAPLPGVVRDLTICRDNDTKDEAKTRQRLDRAVASHRLRGLAVRIACPPRGMDFNDLLRKGAA